MKPQFPSLTVFRVVTLDELLRSVVSICSTLNDCLGQLSGYLARTSERVIVEGVVSPATIGEPFRIAHNLGITPTFVSAIMEAAGGIYASPEDKREWSAASVKIRCSVANTTMIVKVEA